MRINAMEEIYLQPGLHVMDCTWIDVPLETVIEREMCSNYGLEMPGIRWRMKRAGHDYDREQNPSPICFHEEGEKFHLNRGIIYYSSLSELVEFIAEKIDPEGEGPLSEIAGMARTRNGKMDRYLIEDVLDDGLRRRRPGHFSRRQGSLPLTKLERDDRMDLLSVSYEGKRFWAWSLFRFMSINVIFAFEENKQINGHNLPRFVLAKPLIDTGREERMGDMALLAFDGNRHLWCRHLDDLPPALLSDLDQRGAMYYLCDFDILPLEHLECMAVVRVPSRDEVKKLIPEIGSCIQGNTPPHPCLSTPALAFDSHYPIQLPPDMEVVDAPEAALWFLSRTVKGIFIPGQEPRMFPVNNVPERESFQLLTKPGRLAA